MDDLRKEIATALRYKPGTDSAPVVVASGKGLRAKTIKETAKKAGVPIYRDETLARTLHDLGIGPAPVIRSCRKGPGIHCKTGSKTYWQLAENVKPPTPYNFNDNNVSFIS